MAESPLRVFKYCIKNILLDDVRESSERLERVGHEATSWLDTAAPLLSSAFPPKLY